VAPSGPPPAAWCDRRPLRSGVAVQKQKKIYPAPSGLVRQGWRWALVWFTQIIFYGCPGSVERPPGGAVRPGRAALLHLRPGAVPAGLHLPDGLLIISAYALFLFTAVAGRLWCGYACPQTVYTEIFMWFERKIEGDRMPA
jgi:polyferredoxin